MCTGGCLTIFLYRIVSLWGGAAGDLSELARVIVDFEQSDQMTLMHRFNKASDLLDQVQQGQMVGEGGPAEAMATIFVWLRYSSSRQLTWQRNYNTQPRILGEAQNRLTHAIAQVVRLSAPGYAAVWYLMCWRRRTPAPLAKTSV